MLAGGRLERRGANDAAGAVELHEHGDAAVARGGVAGDIEVNRRAVPGADFTEAADDVIIGSRAALVLTPQHARLIDTVEPDEPDQGRLGCAPGSDMHREVAV